MIPAWAILAGLAVTSCYVWMWNRQRRTRRLLAGLPQYTSLPLIGHMHHFFGDGIQLFSYMDNISKISEEAMLPFLIWLGPFPILMTHDPEDLKTMTTSCIEKSFFYKFANLWIGDGLVTASGAIWKQNIKKLGGTFTPTVVGGFQGVFNAQAQKLVESLRKEIDGEPFHILDKYLAYTSLETISHTALGGSEESNFDKEYYETFNRTLELLVARGLKFIHYPDFIYQLTAAHREYKKCVAKLLNISETIITNRKAHREKMKISSTNEEESGKPTFKSYLDILLDLHDEDPSFTEEQIRSEVGTIIFGGQETVSTNLYHVLLMIGCKPKIQEALYDEMITIFGNSNRPVDIEDLKCMRYSEAVLNETLRLFPPIAAVMRYVDRDVQIKSCTVPKDTMCIINFWGAGRSKQVWGPDADQYRPERWFTNQDQTHLAFSCGRRACIGRKYAMAYMKTILAYCVRRYKFESQAENLQFRLDVALRAVSGHLIQIKQRKQNLDT